MILEVRNFMDISHLWILFMSKFKEVLQGLNPKDLLTLNGVIQNNSRDFLSYYIDPRDQPEIYVTKPVIEGRDLVIRRNVKSEEFQYSLIRVEISHQNNRWGRKYIHGASKSYFESIPLLFGSRFLLDPILIVERDRVPSKTFVTFSTSYVVEESDMILDMCASSIIIDQ